MKNLLLLLLLANILYLLWSLYAGEDPDPGVAIVREEELGPPLTVSPAEGDASQSVGALLGAGETADLAAVVGRSCVTIGPFRERADADAAQMAHAGGGMRAAIRSVTGQIFVGHWVQIRNIADREAGNAMLETLHEGGLGDAYLVSTEDEGLKISLGLFGSIERAERIELQARSLGLDPEITPRMSDGTLLYVDVALPPGRGGGAIVEAYGEDMVGLRDAATCPP